MGSFDEIVHHRGGRGGRAAQFRAAVTLDDGTTSEVEFGSRGTIPVPFRLRLSLKDIWLNAMLDASQNLMTQKFGTEKGMWTRKNPVDISRIWQSIGVRDALAGTLYWGLSTALYGENDDSLFQPEDDSPALDKEAADQLLSLASRTWSRDAAHPFAGAPMRSKPSPALLP